MKKYKLIKKFPGSDELGTIITGSKETMYSKGLGYRNYDWVHVEIHPEFWEEIVEKDYEILSQTSVRVCNPKDNYKVVRNTTPVIHSVKRLSDGEVFTVGDKVSREGGYFESTILSINDKFEAKILLRLGTTVSFMLSCS